MIRFPAVAAGIVSAALMTASVASADPMSDLIAALPPGYAPDSCVGTARPVSSMLAGLDCRPVPGVVPGGKYEVFANAGALNAQFTTDFNGTFFKAVPCPGTPGVGPGNLTARSGWSGKVACGWMGKYNDPAVGPVGADGFGVMWTNESRNFWGRVDGTDLGSLWQWFGDVVVAS